MSGKVKSLFCAGALVFLLCLALSQFAPEKRVERYVTSHLAELQAAMDDYFLRG